MNHTHTIHPTESLRQHLESRFISQEGRTLEFSDLPHVSVKRNGNSNMPETPVRRAELVDMMAPTPQFQRLIEQSAVEDLLKAVMEESFNEGDTQEKLDGQVAQFHGLLKTLVSECIVGLVNNNGTLLNEAMLPQVPHILALLESRSERILQLLISTPKMLEGPEGAQMKIPLYRWLVPRLLHAASGLAFHPQPQAQAVGKRILETTVKLTKVLGGYQDEQYPVEGVVLCGELLRGLSESCIDLVADNLKTGAPLCIRTGTRSANSSVIASQCHIDDNPLSSDRHPLYPFPAPKPLRRMAIVTCLVFVIVGALNTPTPTTTAWRNFCADTFFWTLTGIAKLSEALRARSTTCGIGELSEQTTLNQFHVDKQQLMLFQSILPILSKPQVFPFQIGEKVACILAQAVEDRLSTSDDTDMERTDAEVEMAAEIDIILKEMLEGIRKQRAGRANGNAWLTLLGTVEASLSRDDLSSGKKALISLAISAILDPPGATVMQLACSIPNERIVEIKKYLQEEAEQSRASHRDRLIVDEIIRRQAYITGEQQRGTKRKADGRSQATQTRKPRTKYTERIVPAEASQRDLGIGEDMLVDAFASMLNLPDTPNAARVQSGFKARIWDPVVEIFHSASQSRENESLPEVIRSTQPSDIGAMSKDGDLLEQRIDSALTQVVESLASSMSQHEWFRALPALFCFVAGCQGCNGHGVGNTIELTDNWPAPKLSQDSLISWMRFAQCLDQEPHETRTLSTRSILLALRNLCRHAVARELSDFEPRRNAVMQDVLVGAYRHVDRKIRMLAAQATVALVDVLKTRGMMGSQRMGTLLIAMKENLQAHQPLHVQETTICMVAELAKTSEGNLFADFMKFLLGPLGQPNIALRGLAHTQLTQVARYIGKSPYLLLSPFFPDLSPFLLTGRLDLLNEATQFLGISRASFVETTLHYSVPHAVLAQNKAVLEGIAGLVNRPLGLLLVEHPTLMPHVLKAIYMQKQNDAVPKAAAWLMEVLQVLKHGDAPIALSNLLSTHLTNLLVEIIIDLGDEAKQSAAEIALKRVYRACQSNANVDSSPNAFANWLKQNMLGIITGISDTMHDVRGRKTAGEKTKIVRSLGSLIKHVGISMAGFSSQIMAILQSMLPISELRKDVLGVWDIFVTALRFSDIGPHIGTTAAAFVATWPKMNREEQARATAILNYLLVDNSQELKSHFQDVVSLDSIPELAKAAKRVSDLRAKWDFKDRVTAILRRCNSENTALAKHSIFEMKEVLLENQEELSSLARGDSFAPLLGLIYRTLLEVAGRDSDQADDIRLGSFECIGIIGALDPDRFSLPNRERTFMMLTNFREKDEVKDFALHLVESVLVGAFRTANDAKQQIQLAYAIQQLFNFCEFSSKLLHQAGSSSISNKTRIRWQDFTRNKQTLETVAPLLEGRYRVEKIPITHFEYPIYPESSTYREWIRSWTTDLISVVLEHSEIESVHDEQRQALAYAQEIFGSFRGVVRTGQDVAVAHYLLPHLVLYVTNIGNDNIRKKIISEINSVLHDQVNPRGDLDSDRRTLSAQAIFDLLDHLSRWLQEQRVRLLQEQRTSTKKDSNNARTDKTKLLIKTQINNVDRLIAEIDPELTAQAALQSKAFARSLKSFEQRISHLKNHSKRKDADLQDYYEYLHRIYADLDEPDGMEGVTARVLAPSLEHQIREHESVGRWTSAQSCWEVKLQQSPNDVSLHIGLLRCLRSLGHYDTLRTHIDGVLTRHSAWERDLANFQIEAAWVVGDWESVRNIADSGASGTEISMARVLLGIHDRNYDGLHKIMQQARRELGVAVSASSRQYSRAYPAILQLHMLHEVEMVCAAGLKIAETYALQMSNQNKDEVVRFEINQLRGNLSKRLGITLPSFRIRESILSIRRTAYAESPSNNAVMKAEVGAAWIASAKIARKAGHEQTAYSATLQAKLAMAPNVFFQQTKILKATGHPLKALNELENGISSLKRQQVLGSRTAPIAVDGQMTDAQGQNLNLDTAKALILSARWSHETGRYDSNEIISRFNEAKSLVPKEESPYYRLGHYYDGLEGSIEGLACQAYTVENYCKALQNGTKHIYQMLPRMLTLWLDLGERVAAEDGKRRRSSNSAVEPETFRALGVMNAAVEKARKRMPKYQWLTAYPQIVSRIGHPQMDVKDILIKIMTSVVYEYPRQATWLMVGIYNSENGTGDRARRCQGIFQQAKTLNSSNSAIAKVINDAVSFSQSMLRLSTDPGIDTNISKDKRTKANSLNLTVSANFPWLKGSFPTSMIVPTQEALTCSLPTSAESLKSNNPFPQGFTNIQGMRDQIDIMASLQRPKKIFFIGDNAKEYPFLVKPNDDLRKDARLMDFNSMINKLLKSRSETRKRNMYIRTYAVMPLNEECGMLEWVPNTLPLRNILIKGYDRREVKTYSNEIYALLDTARLQGPIESGKAYRDAVLPRFQPCVFHEWFFQTWPEPTAWFAARLAYARTLAVMSMVGFVLGLGDRHGENILFDSTTGDTLHVDFNCLFEKGRTFDVSEKVPFRLTPNLVDALGATGVDGVYRKGCEITMEVLRENKDSLISVLEAFIHDPLVEWQEAKKREERRNRTKGSDVRVFAEKAMGPIRSKLAGRMGDERQVNAPTMSVVNQVEILIKEAVSYSNLGGMYVGWAAWL